MNKKQQKALDKLQAECDKFNAEHKVGDEVFLKKDFVDELFRTKTRSEAQVLSGHSAVIWLENVSGCYLLECVSDGEGVTK